MTDFMVNKDYLCMFLGNNDIFYVRRACRVRTEVAENPDVLCGFERVIHTKRECKNVAMSSHS